MAENGDTSAALRRLEGALNRIAAHVAKPRPHTAPQDPARIAEEISARPAETPPRGEIAAKIDDLIGGLRNALGTSRTS